MSTYLVSSKQLLGSVILIAFFLSAVVWFVFTYLGYLDQPQVLRDHTGRCIRVINFKNGDGYGCQDVDVTLRRYVTVVHVDQAK